MTSAVLLLATAGAAAAVLYVLMCFLQFLAQSAICSGCGLALIDIAQFVPGDIGIIMMTALMASMMTSAFLAWRGWQDAMKRLHLA